MGSGNVVRRGRVLAKEGLHVLAKEWRERYGLTQGEVARTIGVSQGTYISFEAGADRAMSRKPGSIERLRLLISRPPDDFDSGIAVPGLPSQKALYEGMMSSRRDGDSKRMNDFLALGERLEGLIDSAREIAAEYGSLVKDE